MKVVGYSYDADLHCVKCTLDYAREVPYSDYIFGDYWDEDIASDTPGMIDLEKAIELEIIRDSGNNPIHPIFSTDEAGDTPSHCGDCGAFIDDSWGPDTVEYAIDALVIYNEGEGGNDEVLDIWAEHLEGCIVDKWDEFVLRDYQALRRA